MASFPITSSYIEEIERFSKEILINDMNDHDNELLQKQKFTLDVPLLKTTLPLDTTSSPNNSTIITQLFPTFRKNGSILTEYLLKNSIADDQGKRIICAAAASGLGKTYAAYEIGMSDAVSVIIRVATSGTGTGTELTTPWSHHYNHCKKRNKPIMILR